MNYLDQYSPRDIIFNHINANIVKNPNKISFKDKEELVSKVLKGKRFYCHVNWGEGSGGHEFLLLNIDDEVYVMDSQAGLVAKIDSSKGSYYFKDINYSKSFIVRLDNKEYNKDVMKYNDDKYILPWDDVEDRKFLGESSIILSEDIV